VKASALSSGSSVTCQPWGIAKLKRLAGSVYSSNGSVELLSAVHAAMKMTISKNESTLFDRDFEGRINLDFIAKMEGISC
jgi:hypothetical protein